jgi:hypothetical protein
LFELAVHVSAEQQRNHNGNAKPNQESICIHDLSFSLLPSHGVSRIS